MLSINSQRYMKGIKSLFTYLNLYLFSFYIYFDNLLYKQTSKVLFLSQFWQPFSSNLLCFPNYHFECFQSEVNLCMIYSLVCHSLFHFICKHWKTERNTESGREIERERDLLLVLRYLLSCPQTESSCFIDSAYKTKTKNNIRKKK